MAFYDTIRKTVGGAVQGALDYQDPIQQIMNQYGVSRDQALDFLGFNTNLDGGGGGGYTDHFWDISPTNQADIDYRNRMFDYNAGRDVLGDQRFQQGFDYQAGRDVIGDQRFQQQFDYGKSQDAADAAYRQQSLAQQMAMAQMSNASDLQRAQISASAQSAAAAASADAARYSADKQYEVGMAGAQNDAERNRITAEYQQKLAAIGQFEAQTKQYGAETERGRLGVENNRLIAEMARSPRDLFSLYFMQRGITPDFDTMASGGTPASMAPLSAMNVMGGGGGFGTPAPSLSMFTPASLSTALAGAGGATAPRGEGDGEGGNEADNAISRFMGQFSRGGSWGGDATGRAGRGHYMPQAGSGSGRGVYTPPDFGPSGFVDMTEQPGMNGLYYNHKTGLFDLQQAAYNPYTNPAPPGAATQVGTGAQSIPGPEAFDNSQDIQLMADGGLINDQAFVVGDHPSGARTGTEELVYNPTNAPLKVVPNQQSLDWGSAAGGGRSAIGGGLPISMGPAGPKVGSTSGTQRPDMLMYDQRWRGGGQAGPPNPARRPIDQGGAYLDRLRQSGALGSFFGGMNPRARQAMDWGGFGGRQIANASVQPGLKKMGNDPYVGFQRDQRWRGDQSGQGGIYRDSRQSWGAPGQIAYGNDQRMFGIPAGTLSRYALGSELSDIEMNPSPVFGSYPASATEQPASGLMSSTNMPSSTNAYLEDQELPQRLAMLRAQGAPISPALAAAATGQQPGMFNLGAALNAPGGRGLGVIPSLDSLRRMGNTEGRHVLEGYYGGVGGVDPTDILDWLGKTTGHLQAAQRSRGY